MPLRGEAEQKTYYLRDKIANGVWLAHHAILGQNCVQKTYEPAGREDAIAFAEPRLLNDLDHPHITPLREAQYDPDRRGHVTIVMRWYEGGSIHEALAAGHRFSTADALTIQTHICDALNNLHLTKRLVHRDVKPKNVLLSADRKTGFLADFGSAAAIAPGMAVAQAVRTTPLYQAPEAGNTGHVGPAADIYALGLAAFEMLNGLFPYDTLDAGVIDRRLHQGRRALPDRLLAAGAFAPHVPAAMQRLVRRMIDADPGRMGRERR
jgi:eukaryotic-like serine/threonine-protein kinase